MTAEIIILPVIKIERPRGDAPEIDNGAREALLDVAVHLPSDDGEDQAALWADWLLAELWSRGFKVAPVE